ncbi:MAG: transposase, partial [Deltaproteobacteria bacterium]|nr:transposase [Deltaproteobacteria bacterium]
MGKPRKDPRVMVCLAPYQRENRLSDGETVRALRNDLYLKTALGFAANDERAKVSARAFWEFRNRLEKDGRDHEVFTRIKRALIRDYEPDLSVAREDASRIESNMASMGRFRLLFTSVERFLKRLARLPEAFASVDRELAGRYIRK